MIESKGHIFVPGNMNNKFLYPDFDFTGFEFKSGEDKWTNVKNNLIPWDIFAVKECESTMDSLNDIIEDCFSKDFTSLISMNQKKGRGQHKRIWYSDKGNLSASLHIPLVFNGKWSENYLPLIFGDLIAEVLDDFGVKVQIKWPNDIFFKGRKLGGILVEKKKDFYIVGIGLNLFSSQRVDFLDNTFEILPVSLYEEKVVIKSPLLFWTVVLEHVFNFFNKRLAKESPSDLINSLIQKMVWLNEEVFLDDPYSGIQKYILKGLSEEGGLLLYDGRVTKVVYSGRIRSVNH
jgi:BirA family biotin operon repressor/biotin-[acetyl-CoA-carboxylase] ligase